MTSRPVCGRPTLQGTCQRDRMKGKQQCQWHWLLRQPTDVQDRYAANRRENQLGHDFAVHQATVPKEKWPDGERWCAGCQSFVPLFYCSGSKCKACSSKAAHSARVAKIYGISGEQYDELFAAQRGRCFICGRKSTRRLAVDHDHATGEVRGLLCPDVDRGCNHKVVGLLEANSIDGGLAAARRVVEYLEDPPTARLARGEALPRVVRQQAAPEGYTAPPPF